MHVMNALRYYTPPTTLHRKTITCDLCIYGGTSGALAAATHARRLGLSVVVLEPSPQIGGMTTSGLGLADVGNKGAIGGISGEFFRRIAQHYGEQHWRFEPKVASRIFDEWIAEEQIELYRESFLAGVEVRQRRLTRLWTENGLEVIARQFIDATYEGDLMAAAGVSFTFGRESNALYGEQYNGAQRPVHHQFDLPVSPYRVEGDAASGVLPGISPYEPKWGEGDRLIQAYNFRLCLSRDPAANRPFTRPWDYDRSRYELLARYCRAGWNPGFVKFDELVNGKIDLNNSGGFSTDYIGGNHAYPLASYQERERIFQDHVSYTLGLLWFWKQDQDVPEEYRDAFAKWGWSTDEFVEQGGFSPMLYIREARRLLGDLVMTEHHCTGAAVVDDPIGLAAYTMDSHNCQRFATSDGRVLNEGDVQVRSGPPYPISYRSIIPRRGECENLLVPFCLSASHIAFGSIRMEPVFMILAQSAVDAAQLAMERECAVQEVPYERLRERLEAAGQVLSREG